MQPPSRYPFLALPRHHPAARRGNSTWRGLASLVGRKHCGKTTVCRHVTANLHPGLFRVYYVSLTTGNVLDMYKSIAWQLGLPTERSRATAYRAIRAEITRLVQESKLLPVLIVDEAQFLRNDVLDDLRLLTLCRPIEYAA